MDSSSYWSEEMGMASWTSCKKSRVEKIVWNMGLRNIDGDEAILVYDPISYGTICRLFFIKHPSFLHSNKTLQLTENGIFLVFTSVFPLAWQGGFTPLIHVAFLHLFCVEEVPLLHLNHLNIINTQIKYMFLFTVEIKIRNQQSVSDKSDPKD